MAKVHMCSVCIDILSRFSATRTYLTQVQKGLSDTKNRLYEERDERIDDLGGNPDEAEVTLEYQIAAHIADVQFPRQSNYAGVVLVFSAAEMSFERLCDGLAGDRDLPVKLDGFGGKLVDKVRSFFRVYDLPAPSELELARLREFSRVRNQVVHAGGRLHRISEKLQNYINNTEGLNVDLGEIDVSYEYVIRHLDLFEEMFRRLLPELGYTGPYVEED